MNKTYELHRLKVSYLHIHNFSYIIVDKHSGQAAIIDPAWDIEQVMNVFHSLRAKPDVILLTHSHHDHVNLVKELVQEFDSQVYMSALEIDTYNFQSTNLQPLYDFDTIHVGETPITCLLTPGHTAGGMCFLLSESIFTGDTVFIEGCGICSTRAAAEQMFDSIQKIKNCVKPYIRIYPGHSYGKAPGYPLNYVQENNIYFQLNKLQHFVDFRMRKNQKNLFQFM